MMEQVETARDGTGGETSQWNRWREHMMEQVKRACDGSGGDSM